MGKKEPAFMYYPKDWRADAVFSCSIGARGLWHEMLNMMHASERYGYLSNNGLPIPDEQVARYCGVSLMEYQTLLTELERAGVPRRTSNGIIFSRRMVEDFKARANWRKLKQNQRLKTGAAGCPPVVHSMSSPSSSSSAFPSAKKEESKTFAHREPDGQEFEIFWEAYPKKLGKKKARTAWIRARGAAHLGEVLASLQDWKQTTDWQKENGQYIPYPATWLNGDLWKENPRVAVAVAKPPSLEDQLRLLQGGLSGQRG